MLRKILVSALVLAMACVGCVSAVAEVTNRDMQLLGGVVVSNANDSFFFAPMEEGLTSHWGLYALSKAATGPIVEIQQGYPARLVHADDTHVYFLGYTDAERSVHALYSIEIATGSNEELLSDIGSAFVSDKAEEILYVKASDLYTLRSYNLKSKKDTAIKDMSKSEKTIYDAGVYGGATYFLTLSKSGGEDGYQYHESSGKATNLEKPSPQPMTGMLYEGYRIYATDMASTQVYSMKVGSKESKRLGAEVNLTLTNPRFGENIYTYDGASNELIAVPLDGSAISKMTLEGPTLVRLVLGGSKDEMLLISGDAIYAISPALSSQTKVIDFDQRTGGQAWTHVVPAVGANAIIVMGYGQDTLSSSGNLMPTGVYAYDRSSGEMLFGFPDYDPESATEEPVTERPETLGEPVQQSEEGETYFQFAD